MFVQCRRKAASFILTGVSTCAGIVCAGDLGKEMGTNMSFVSDGEVLNSSKKGPFYQYICLCWCIIISVVSTS